MHGYVNDRRRHLSFVEQRVVARPVEAVAMARLRAGSAVKLPNARHQFIEGWRRMPFPVIGKKSVIPRGAFHQHHPAVANDLCQPVQNYRSS